MIGSRALEFSGILDDDDAVASLRHFGQHGIQKSRLAAARTTGSDNVPVIFHGLDDDIPLMLAHRALPDIIIEAEHA